MPMGVQAVRNVSTLANNWLKYSRVSVNGHTHPTAARCAVYPAPGLLSSHQKVNFRANTGAAVNGSCFKLIKCFFGMMCLVALKTEMEFNGQ